MEQMSRSDPAAQGISNGKCMLTAALCCIEETNGHPAVGVACRLYVSYVYSSGRSPNEAPGASALAEPPRPRGRLPNRRAGVRTERRIHLRPSQRVYETEGEGK